MKSGFSGLCKILVTVKLPYNNSRAESTQSWLMPCTWRWNLASWNRGGRIQQGDGEVEEEGENQGNEDRAFWTSESLWDPNLISSAWFHCGDAKQLNTCKIGRTPELTEMSRSASGTKRSVRKGQNIFLHQLLNRLFTPLKRAPRKLHVARAHGAGDPRLWHLARLDSEHFMEG